MFVWCQSTQFRLLCAVLLQLSALPAWTAQPAAEPPSQQEYQARVNNKDWDAAIESAQRLVAAARESHAAPDKIAAALSLLGDAQLGKADFAAAESTFTEALRTIEPAVRGADPRLIDPLRGLGYALASQEKHAQAVPYMEKALAISRRTAGLFDVEQQGLLRQLAASFASLGKPEEAEQQMQYLLRVGEHAYGAADLRMAPLLCVIGDWYAQRGQMTEAREYYRTALGIVEKKQGRNDLAAVEPLRSLAQSYVHEMVLASFGILTPSDKFSASADRPTGEVLTINPRFLSTDGERALLRALAILDSNAERPAGTLLDTLLQAGDWYEIKLQPDKALPYYQRAAVAAEAGDNRHETVLGFPVQVYYPTPLIATRNLNRPSNEIVERFVQVEFTVTRDGAVTDERVVDQDATQRQISQTLEAIRAARYRPKFVQGQPVATQAVSYRQIFKQRKDAE
jgi:tetratricopeptide (TPR) repeat protein